MVETNRRHMAETSGCPRGRDASDVDSASSSCSECGSDGQPCAAELREWAGLDVIGCASSASDEDDELWLPPIAAEHGGSECSEANESLYCSCCAQAPLEGQTRLLCAALVAQHGKGRYFLVFVPTIREIRDFY
eukprot:SAG31_NODE_690_length_12796_cov_4.634559_17_plen_133_part_01